MRIVIANFGAPLDRALDFDEYWRAHPMPPLREKRLSLFEQRVDWGFHIYSIGVYLMDQRLADCVEFWDYTVEHETLYLSNGVLKVTFFNERDVAAYVRRYGYPDLFVNHGRCGVPVLEALEGKCFRVYVPALRSKGERNHGAECYLVDSEEYLDSRSRMYIPVV